MMKVKCKCSWVDFKRDETYTMIEYSSASREILTASGKSCCVNNHAFNQYFEVIGRTSQAEEERIAEIEDELMNGNADAIKAAAKRVYNAEFGYHSLTGTVMTQRKLLDDIIKVASIGKDLGI